MTTYGTIPTSYPPGTLSPDYGYISRAKQRIKAGLATRRPWKVMFHLHSFKIASGFSYTITRIKTNISYFQMNYAIMVLLILFLALIWHPVSLLVFLAMMGAWIFLYFMRDEPLVILGRTINDRLVLGLLSALTLVFLLLTHATKNIVVALLIGLALVAVHTLARTTEDLFWDEETAGIAADAPAADLPPSA